MQERQYSFRDLEKREKPTKLSFKEVQEYLACAHCYFGKRVRKNVIQQEPSEEVKIGIFVASVISRTHLLRQRKTKFKTPESLHRFAFYGMGNYLVNKEFTEYKEYVKHLSAGEWSFTIDDLEKFKERGGSEKDKVKELITSYWEDSDQALVMAQERKIEGQIAGVTVWGKVDQIRGRGYKSEVMKADIVDLKTTNEMSRFAASLQLGIYADLIEQTGQYRDIRQVAYHIPKREVHIMENPNKKAIQKVIGHISQALEMGFDGQNPRHEHFVPKPGFSGATSSNLTFEDLLKQSKPRDYNEGAYHHRQAKIILSEYYNSLKWQTIPANKYAYIV